MDRSRITTENKANDNHIQGEEEEEITEGNEEIETLKNRIRGHDLFRILIEKHMDCLKVSLGDTGDVRTTFEAADNTESSDNSQLFPDLDKLMELHCMALGNLKEDMEIELQETLSFINDMYLELNN